MAAIAEPVTIVCPGPWPPRGLDRGTAMHGGGRHPRRNRRRPKDAAPCGCSPPRSQELEQREGVRYRYMKKRGECMRWGERATEVQDGKELNEGLSRHAPGKGRGSCSSSMEPRKKRCRKCISLTLNSYSVVDLGVGKVGRDTVAARRPL